MASKPPGAGTPARIWVEPTSVRVPPALAQAVGGHPLVAQTLARRSIQDPREAAAFLDPDLYRPTPASELPNLVKATERILAGISRGERVLVWGDFDADGQTATTVLVSTLRDLGARVGYHIPDRNAESHGIRLPMLSRRLDEGVDLIVTCDTGISAHEAIAYAQDRGVDVIVTDHHDLTAGVPPAFAAVDPKMLPQGHPLRELPGVGCAYKLAEALYEGAGRPEAADALLDLVAIGIVADVAVLSGDTRYLLQRGLQALRRTSRLGLQELMKTAQVEPPGLTETHIGFLLGPRLNALGRMANAQVAVEFLTTKDVTRARILANHLEGLNLQRKLACNQVTSAAEAQIERDPSLLDSPILVLSHPTWPAGIIGIVAGRLAERYHRPTVLIASPPGAPGRGSARSVEGCSIVDALSAHSEMLHSYGGHPMAAGFSIEADRIDQFRRALARTVRERCGDRPAQATVRIDSYVALEDVSLELAGDLGRLAPFGAGNPPIVLASRELTVRRHSRVGRGDVHQQLIIEDREGTSLKAIWWQAGGSPVPEGRFDLAFTARVNDYRGRNELQLEWLDARAVDAPRSAMIPEAPAIEVVDHRHAGDPQYILARLRAEGSVQVWAEAGHRAEVGGQDRDELGPGQVLAIWTAPPGNRELEAALARVSPETVHLFGLDPGLDDRTRFLRRLAGLVKKAFSEGEEGRGHARLRRLAAATAQSGATVRAGLDWLVARGLCSVEVEGHDAAISAGRGTPSSELRAAAARITALLEEAAAYRAHFARAEAQSLVAPGGQ